MNVHPYKIVSLYDIDLNLNVLIVYNLITGYCLLKSQEICWILQQLILKLKKTDLIPFNPTKLRAEFRSVFSLTLKTMFIAWGADLGIAYKGTNCALRKLTLILKGQTCVSYGLWVTYIVACRFGGPVVLLEIVCISSSISLCRSKTNSSFRFRVGLNNDLKIISFEDVRVARVLTHVISQGSNPFPLGSHRYSLLHQAKYETPLHEAC